MTVSALDVEYAEVTPPALAGELVPVPLTNETMARRLARVLAAMHEEGLDVLAIYADREHGDNYEYLTGYSPRFEEAVLVLHAGGHAYNLVGNESLGMNSHARLRSEVVHVPYFSLPNQPLHDCAPLPELMRQAGVRQGMRVGIAGWKLLRGQRAFDVPSFIVEALREAAGPQGTVVNATGLFIDPARGARITNNANEIAHYEFGAALASRCVLRTLDRMEPGVTEMELAQTMCAYGQQPTVQTICAGGDRFRGAEVAPRARAMRRGETYSLTAGYQGGLTNRTGYIAGSADELPAGCGDYLERVAKPYYAAAATWYASVGVGASAGEVFDAVEEVIPRERYGWELNPGHYTASEEWLSSPFFPGSPIRLASGMMLQMDIIVRVPGYGGLNAEDGIALANEQLREQIASQYPSVWERMMRRRKYMTGELGLGLAPEVLPLSDTEGYTRPFALRHTCALRVGRPL